MGKGLAQCTLTRGTQRKPVPSIAGPQMSEDTNEVSRWGLRPEKLKKKKKVGILWGFAFGFCCPPTSVLQEDVTSALHIVNRDSQQLAHLKGSITDRNVQAAPVLWVKKSP